MQHPGYLVLVFFAQQFYRHFYALSLFLGHLLYFIFHPGASQNSLFGSGLSRLWFYEFVELGELNQVKTASSSRKTAQIRGLYQPKQLYHYP
jgi:hypothetical protein